MFSPADQPLRTALIGYGYAGRTFHGPLLTATPGIELVLVVSSRPESLHAELPQCTVLDFAAVLDRPDIELVVIATPNATHFDLARRALQAGKHVVVDKPFTVNLGEAHQLVQLAATHGRLLTVFHNRRWDGDFMTMRRLLQQGALGTLSSFESRFDRFRPVVPDRWRDRAGPGSGTWFDLGPHLVDQALVLFGIPLAVYGDLASQRDQSRTVDYFHVILRYPTLRVVLSSNYLAAAPGPRFRVFGTAGSYIKYGFDPQEDALRQGQRPLAGVALGAELRHGILTHMTDGIATATEVPTEAGNYLAFYAAVRDAISGIAPPPVGVAEILSVMRILELATTSALERRELAIA